MNKKLIISISICYCSLYGMEPATRTRFALELQKEPVIPTIENLIEDTLKRHGYLSTHNTINLIAHRLKPFLLEFKGLQLSEVVESIINKILSRSQFPSLTDRQQAKLLMLALLGTHAAHEELRSAIFSNPEVRAKAETLLWQAVESPESFVLKVQDPRSAAEESDPRSRAKNIVDSLLKAGISTEIQNERRETPLLVAINTLNKPLVEHLIYSGAHVEPQALKIAAERKKELEAYMQRESTFVEERKLATLEEIIKLLLAQGELFNLIKKLPQDVINELAKFVIKPS